jgi:ABC-type multidrug transport system fused ATPase/permease subunit
LRLSSSGRKEFSNGEIVNVMSVDSQRVIEFFVMVNTFWSTPLQISIALILLWQQLGMATLAGMIFMIILLPLNGCITTRMKTIQTLLMKEKDKRVKLMSEILNGVKVLKFYAWENSFSHRVMGYRQKEIKSHNIMAYLSGVIIFTFNSAPFFVRHYYCSLNFI